MVAYTMDCAFIQSAQSKYDNSSAMFSVQDVSIRIAVLGRCFDCSELAETQALSSDWTSAHRTLNRLPILSISASSSHIFRSAQNLYLSMTPDCISLLVYRLVHAPVTTMSARKRGSTPRQRVFSSWSCDSVWSYIIVYHSTCFSIF